MFCLKCLTNAAGRSIDVFLLTEMSAESLGGCLNNLVLSVETRSNLVSNCGLPLATAIT